MPGVERGMRGLDQGVKDGGLVSDGGTGKEEEVGPDDDDWGLNRL